MIDQIGHFGTFLETNIVWSLFIGVSELGGTTSSEKWDNESF